MKVLVVAPHADDEVIGTGGIIQDHVAKGDEITVAIVTDRVLEHFPDPAYNEKVHAEADKVRALLGYKQLVLLTLDDECLDQGQIGLIRALEEDVGQDWDRVYIPWRYDTNQDHRAVHKAALVAYRKVRNVLAYECPGSTTNFTPQFLHEMSKTAVDKKVEAMLQYESEVRPSTHPRSKRGIMAVAAYRGLSVGVEYAEAFVPIRFGL